jgi:hypothetical protein
MKKFVLYAILLALAVPMPVLRAGQVQIQLHSLSLRFQPATNESQGLKYRLELTSDSPAATQPNGELAPLPEGAASSHGCFYRFTIDILTQPSYGSLSLNVPSPTDKNTNGIPDFFEINQAVSATTTGQFEDAAQRDQVTAVWNRAAGSRTGSCRLTMAGYNLTFVHTFEIQQLTGTLDYSSTAANITGTVRLMRNMDTNQVVSGQALFDKISMDLLTLKPGAWTDASSRTYTFLGSEALNRQERDYLGIFEFKDGDPGTQAEDYILWLLKITDTSDANRNGIPDLSDEPVARQPSLTLGQTKTNLLFNVSGLVGQLHQIERTATLNPSLWTLAASVTLTNDPQVVRLPIPTNAVSFWRVKVP